MSTSPLAAVGPQWNRRPVMVFAGQADTHINTGEDYGTVTLAEVFHMKPADKAKDKCLGFLPSSYHDFDGRSHAVQRAKGEFVALCGDVDKGEHPLEHIETLVRGFARDAAWLIYSTANSRPGNKRWRVVLPLEQVVGFDDWHDAQNAFFNFMEVSGVPMDRAMDRAGQPVFLPNVPAEHNSGEPLRDGSGDPLYYERKHSGTNAPGLSLDRGAVGAGVAAIRHKRAEDDKAREMMRRDAEARKAQRPRADNDGISVMEEFNRSNSIANLLEVYGYKQSPRHGEDWRSPHQEGDSYATRIMGDAWVSLSMSDAAAGVGARCKSGCFGDAYDLFVHFDHKGDHKAAHRQLHAERKAAGPQPERYSYAADLEPEYDPETGEPVYDMPDYYSEGSEPAAEAAAPPEGDASDTFQLLNLTELEALPPPKWLVHEVISEDGLTTIYGDPGTGKSFIALDMGLRIALGHDWHGAPTKRVGVLYIAGEGARGIGKRVAGWRMKHGADWDDAPFMLLPVAVQFMEPSERAKLIRTIDEAKRRAGFDIGLVVIDTISRAIAGQDENGQDTMSAFVKACDEVRAHCGGAVLGVHHSGKDKDRGMRGSTVLLGACDATMRLTKDGERITLKCEKQKDAEEFQPVYLRLEQYKWNSEDGDEVSTLIPLQAAAPEADHLSYEAIDQAFGLLTGAWSEGKALSNKTQTRSDGRYAPSIFTKRLGGSEKAWKEHIEAWLESGHLTLEEYDRRNKKFGLRVISTIRWGN
ncbi:MULTISPECIES: helicase RepA family protein [unclassified Novosphingobium]|uniref:helicase RepA family protein n=1 Tax=unclassified Novosphingobium TaxID=2644732 RepID=UPI001359924A|nr:MULTISPECIES: helicase RepA family protein [unclassified Novosphingobium]